ncbi:hypothetical protein [Xiamenia xianingshaonis]|uniref:Uncharacterized protein n=1 Tax=Xiamenia xianingshaonis TaxID=2682776 RepID=A0A9E6SU81_9ACTN|nr:hypothetical protein [Xiamenia xianingshaonis]NGM18355.1 hypothetical protein [Eggerthellaceae bacterium zg-893]NHM15017.1 hypothetical protein [Xiamenia xianingshaonis]QTU84265.1 hypothetical protein J7S26_07945 [Xiamenia xianingshaonis]
MKITKNLTRMKVSVQFEQALTEDELQAVFAQNGVKGYRAELDIVERTEEHVQMMELDSLIGFAKEAGMTALAYDVTYFPHADEAEVQRQLSDLARELDIKPQVIRDLCRDQIDEYLRLDAMRPADVPVHSIVETYIGGTALAWYGVNDYPRLKRVILNHLVKGGKEVQDEFIEKATKAQVDLIGFAGVPDQLD